MKGLGNTLMLRRWLPRLFFRTGAMGNRHAYRGRLLQSTQAQQSRRYNSLAGLTVCVLSVGIWFSAWQSLPPAVGISTSALANTQPPASTSTMPPPTAQAQSIANPPQLDDEHNHDSALAQVRSQPSLFAETTRSTAGATTEAPQQRASFNNSPEKHTSAVSDPTAEMAAPQAKTQAHWQIQIVPLSAILRQQHQPLMQQGLQAEYAGAWALAQAAYLKVLQHDAHAVDALAGLCRIAQQQADHHATATCLEQLRRELPDVSVEAITLAQHPPIAQPATILTTPPHSEFSQDSVLQGGTP